MAVRNTRRRQRGAGFLNTGFLNILSFGKKEESPTVNSAGSTNSTQKKSLLNRFKNWGKGLFVKESPLSTPTKPATSIGKPLVPLNKVVVSPGTSPAGVAQSSTAPVVAVSPGVSPNPPTTLTMNTPPGSASSGIKVSVPVSGLPQNSVQVSTPGMPPMLTTLGGRRKNKCKQSRRKQSRRKQSRRKQSRRKQSRRKQSRRNRK